ncbi:MAG: porphobilinogen synthase [Bacillota bacterium]
MDGRLEPDCPAPLRRRMRRLRRTGAMRALVAEVRLDPGDFVNPFFVVPGRKIRREIEALPGNHHLSVDEFLREVDDVAAAGLGGLILFGLPERKDAEGSSAWDPDGPVQRAVRAAKERCPDLLVLTDVCLCQYTEHGHCGLLAPDGGVDNDATLDRLARVALSHARAGADVVAPSDMMDGRVGAIRQALDAEGFTGVAILAYSAKYASGFYGPFRAAAGSAPAHGDRRGYQMDPAAGVRQALAEVALDAAEGADMVMVKPALPYLDVIRAVREACCLPVGAYQVSGEYAMLRAAADRGWLDERTAALETLTAIRRAGADFILSYYARRAAGWLRDGT